MELNEEIAAYIRELFDLENKDTVIAIIQKYTLTTIKENYTEGLRRRGVASKLSK